MKHTLILLLLISLLTSCFKEDEKIEDVFLKHKEGHLQVGQVVLGSSYIHQVFYDLASNTNAAVNPRDAWDLAFECKDDAWHVILNYGQMMYAGNSMDTNFANVTSDAGLEMLFDPSDGNLDSTALKDWYYIENDTVKSNKYVYVIDRGMDGDFSNLGKKKIQIDLDGQNYLLKYADLNGDNTKMLSIPKNDIYNFTYVSFDDDAVVTIAPPKNAWTLQFTKYATMLKSDEGDDVPYFVTGVLLNPENVTAVLDTTDFSEISIQDTAKYEFTPKKDGIGYNWKYYNMDNGVYTVRPNLNYIIKNHDNHFYKLRFTDFYDSQGNKGTVSFETVRL